MGRRGAYAHERRAQNGAAMLRQRILVHLEEHPGLHSVGELATALGVAVRSAGAAVEALLADDQVVVRQLRRSCPRLVEAAAGPGLGGSSC